MIACKEAVFAGHKRMLRLYEKYCSQTDIQPVYFGEFDDIEYDCAESGVAPAEKVGEASCAEGF